MHVQKSFRVVFFYRKPRPTGNSSIEFLFDTIRANMPPHIKAVKKVARYFSNGLWRRLWITIDAALHQGDINHVTGDTHFLSLLLKKKRTVLTIHDCVFMQHPSRVARLIFKWFWLRLPVRCSKVVTVVSETTKKELLQYVACDPGKIVVVPIFVSGNFVSQPKIFNTEKPVILHIGTAPNKNLERLVEALDGISCKLVIVGKLNTRQQAHLKKYKIDFFNTYSIPESKVKSLYEQCDMLAFVSTYEGFGMPILEAQVVGRPVLTGNISSMPEVAADGACLVNPFDVQAIRSGIQRIIQDEDYRRQIIENGWQNCKRFSIQATSARYAALYEALIKENDRNNKRGK